jgi:hypothetical protein
MLHPPARSGHALALWILVSACSASPADKADSGANGPRVLDPGAPTSCTEAASCAAPPSPSDDPTHVTTTGDGTPVFGNEVSNEGGIRLSDKIDLLFVVDNSASMGDKQQIFGTAIPDLLERLVNPPCLNAELTETFQPATAEETCPAGFGRQFAPVKDIHVGIITSSLGAHGAENPVAGCSELESDKGYMIGALDRGRVVPPYRDLGFLSWDPEQRVQPPGATELPELERGFVDMLGTVGEAGCGFEAPLEAMYRFLMDPAPHASLRHVPCNAADSDANCVRPEGIDRALLEQRNAFLRPDSVVAIVMLADEDDCSIRDTDIGWWQADEKRGITRASAACDSDPNDACCYSCSFEAPPGCSPKREDAGCCPPGAGGVACAAVEPLISPEEEQLRLGRNLRCFDQKRKYGYDYLYPVQRYVLGLTSPWLPEGFDEQGRPLTDAEGNVRFLKNPLYSQPLDDQGNVRAKEQVFFVGVVGVPWQDVATEETRDVQGQLDLIPASDFAATRLWERILGSTQTGVLPEDPFARESALPRAGVTTCSTPASSRYPSRATAPRARRARVQCAIAARIRSMAIRSAGTPRRAPMAASSGSRRRIRRRAS